MPGSFPYVPPPHPEDDEQQIEAGEEVPGLLLEDETAFVDSPEAAAGQSLPLPASESLLPPEAQGETNGGPLGCCLGITVGIMLSLLLGIIGFGPFIADGIVSFIHTDAISNTRIATAFFGLIGAFLGGYFGWKIGKRVYREYEPPVIIERRISGRKSRATPREAKL